jgi:hypothetical protein
VKPDEIDRILAQAADRALPPGAGRDAKKRVERAILNDLQPVRPLAPAWVFAVVFAVLFAAISVGVASVLGMHGIRALSPDQRFLIFPALLAAAWFAAVGCAREMRPAAGSHLGARTLILSASVFTSLFSLIFHGYSTQNFVPEGVPCLVIGLGVSISAGLVIFYILRRGCLMDWSMAGLAAGVLSGLTGLGMLELDCPNLKAIHVLTWHVTVLVGSGLLGYTGGWFADYFGRVES